jgi:hypothetical protein
VRVQRDEGVNPQGWTGSARDRRPAIPIDHCKYAHPSSEVDGTAVLSRMATSVSWRARRQYAENQAAHGVAAGAHVEHLGGDE